MAGFAEKPGSMERRSSTPQGRRPLLPRPAPAALYGSAALPGGHGGRRGGALRALGAGYQASVSGGLWAGLAARASPGLRECLASSQPFGFGCEVGSRWSHDIDAGSLPFFPPL